VGDRLDPLDEALRLWKLLTAAERTAFLESVESRAAAGYRREAGTAPPEVTAGGRGAGNRRRRRICRLRALVARRCATAAGLVPE